MASFISGTVIGVAAAGVALVYAVHLHLERKHPLPPGPKRVPVLGNLLQMPLDNAPVIFHEWSKVHGDVMYLKIPRQSLLILDSIQAATDLLDKRSAIYSDRPPFPLYDLFGWETCLALLPYNKKLIKGRQMHQAYLHRQKCAEHKPMQLQEARTLVNNLFDSDPADYQTYLSRFATGIITQIVAGHKIESNDDPYIRISKMVLESFDEAGPPGRSIIDLFPVLGSLPRWMPGTFYARVADKWRSTVQEMHDFPFREVRAEREAGVVLPSFVLTQLTELESAESYTAQEEQDMKGSACAMFAAGEVSTWASLSVFLLMMVLHPECQQRAQKEIDDVIGPGRLPEFNDRENLPYVECLYQEVYRWAPVVPLGLPHCSTKDDIYRGMFIPKGTVVLANLRGMTLNDSIYTNPTAFNPDRYLKNKEPFFASKFGFGRRICTGQYLADNSVWVGIATMLATCNMTNALDEDGKIIIPDGAMYYGLDSHPKPFDCVVQPRRPSAEKLIRDAMTFTSV
ncbi:cytochrome P450 [Mycena amicta]|nr:cytochrome P450 [Mycena amicta]